MEAGTYAFTAPVRVMSLPNAKGYIHIGDGTLEHGMESFTVRGTGEYGAFEMVKPVPSLYSCHIEFDYLGKYGDCVDLNTLEDTAVLLSAEQGFCSYEDRARNRRALSKPHAKQAKEQ